MAYGFDPTLSAYLRTMGVQEQNVYAEARTRSNISQRAYTRSVPMWAEKERSGIQEVTDDAQVRGVYGSGAMLRNIARARTGVALERGEARAQANDVSMGYNLDAARRVAELRMGAAEAQFDARTRQSELAARARYGR